MRHFTVISTLRPSAAGDLHLELLLRLDAREAEDVDGLVAFDAERLGGIAAEELQRQDAHADQVGAVDALEAARDDRLDAEQLRAFGRPVAR